MKNALVKINKYIVKFVKRWLVKLRKRRSQNIYRFLKTLYARPQICKIIDFKDKIILVENACKQINSCKNKYEDTKNMDIASIDVPKIITSGCIKYVDIYFKIQKYELKNASSNHQQNIENLRQEHYKQYAKENAENILEGVQIVYKPFVIPEMPSLR